MKLEQDHELDMFGKPCMIAIPHGTSDYIGFEVKEQEDQIPASRYLSKGDDGTNASLSGPEPTKYRFSPIWKRTTTLRVGTIS
ncbi:hypothetical protein RMATCC62417_04842 [Rhizopus microsporus]|nr:hypothetical protein RMATCC62417_04842 [Rhizopus microsporus]